MLPGVPRLRRKPIMRRFAIAAALLILPFAAAVAQSDEGPPRWAANIVRKQQVIMHGSPTAICRDARFERPIRVAKLERGRMVFDRNCAACHGWTGQGTGPDAFAQVPAPADLEWLARTPKADRSRTCTGRWRRVDRPSSPKCRHSRTSFAGKTSGR